MRLHGEGGVYDLCCSQPPGGDQRARSLTFPDMWCTPNLNIQYIKIKNRPSTLYEKNCFILALSIIFIHIWM